MLSKSKGIGVGVGGGGGNTLNTNIFYVSSLTDLPTPVGDNIMIPADFGLIIDGKTIDLGVNNLILLGSTTIQGLVQNVSALTSSHVDGTIVNSGASTLSIDKVDLFNTNGIPIAYSMDDDDAIIFASNLQLFADVNISKFRFVVFNQIQSFSILTFDSFANGTFLANETAWIQLSAINSIIFKSGSNVSEVTLGSTISFVTITDGNGILIENPDSVAKGTLNGITKLGLGNLLACKPVAESTFSLTGSSLAGLAFDGINLISCTSLSNAVTRYVGVTSTVDVTLFAVEANFTGVVWARGNLITQDGADIRVHAGFGVAVTDTFSTPGTNPVGITYDGTNLISLDSVTGIHVHAEITSTVTENFVSPAGSLSRDITFDGVNLIIIGFTTVFVMKGISSITQYKFEIDTSDLKGLVITDIGAVISDEDDIANVFNHPITFDHSSATWDITNSAIDIVESSDRGGSQYSDGIIPITVVQNVWTDIADSGTLIFYGAFNGMEKCRLNNEENGEIIWTGVRDRGRAVSGQVVITRSTGGGGTDIIYEIAVVINGIIQTDGSGIGVLPSVGIFVTVNSLPITRDLVAGDLIKIQIRNVTNAVSPEISVNKLSIN